MDNFGIIILAAVLAGAVAIAVSVWGKARREELAAVAARLGLEFDQSRERSFHRGYEHGVFHKGHGRVAFNQIFGTLTMGERPVRIRMGDYRYTTGHGKNRSVHRLSFALFHLPWVGTPDLLIRKEHVGDKLAGALGFDDIDFESEEFSRSFFVKSKDKRYAYDVIHPRMMEFLLKGPTPSAETVSDVCLVREGWGYWSPERFLRMPSWFEAFLDHWPDHVIEGLQRREGSWS